jgi:large subunit ribosomal protein L10
MKTKADKQLIVSTLAGKLKNSVSSVFVHFHKLTVEDEYPMRRELTAKGVKYFITRKSLMKRAAADAGVTGDVPELKGEMAMAHLMDGVEGDITSVPGAIYEFVKKLKDKMSIAGGIVEGKFVSAAEMLGLATIPPVPVLRGMFVNVINSPIQGFVVALSKIAEKKG